jgi:hypothetical protein
MDDVSSYSEKVNTKWRAVVAFACFCTAPGMASVVKFDLPDDGGKNRSLRELAGSRGTVLLFLGVDCPISNRYAPLLERMRSTYEGRGVRFVAVFSGPGLDGPAVRHHLDEYSLHLPALLDRNASLAAQTGAKVTPEAVLLGVDGQVVYRGRIDDQYVAWGKTRLQPTVQDLRDALDQTLAGQPIAHPVTKALGCSIMTPY